MSRDIAGAARRARDVRRALILVGVLVMSACANPTNAPLPPLDPVERDLRTRLQAHVVMLGLTIGERNAWKPEGAERAAQYIETSFAGIGLDPKRLPYTVPRSAVGGPFGFVGALAERLPAEQT
ncbi:MAG: hypothetical protein FJX37_08070, partial [Alphaproteobacteria bacterium]|nr:hypothetical protein [Alphaproteobacteria bacterium]